MREEWRGRRAPPQQGKGVAMRKELWGWGVVCLAVLCGQVAGAEAKTESPVLRLVTYNIHHAEGLDKVVDLDRIVAVILALSPDVVCLQEVDRDLPRTSKQDFVALLSQKLGMPGYFSANYRFQGGEYGNATFSRLPLISWSNEALPGGEGLEPRGRLETVFTWEGASLRVWNTHLGLKAEERERQAAHILSHGFLADTVFCGDMNENTLGKGMRQVLAALGEAPDARVCDDPSFPAGAPKRRIDHVFAGGDFEMTRCEVVRTETTAVASDHLPIVAEIRRVAK